MEVLQNIADQTFYFASISELKPFCSENECALVIDKENDLVVVTRWLEPNKIGAFMTKIYAALD